MNTLLIILITVNLVLTFAAAYLQARRMDRQLIIVREVALMVMASVMTLLIVRITGI